MMRVGLFKPASSASRPDAGHSSIRGKISGPIPMADAADDDEFPMRQPGTGLAKSLGNDGPLHQLQLPPEGSSANELQHRSSPVPDAEPEQSSASTVQPGASPASNAFANSPPRRTDRTTPLRYSTLSGGTDTSRPQRKKSTLRSALSKLFGRKKRSPGDGSKSESKSLSSTVQHRSNPPALGRPLTKEAEPKRSASLPITEYDRALRSHSIGPGDMIAIESARNSLQGEPIKHRRRAATTSTSRLLIARSRDFGDLAGLSPRPASTQARGSQALDVEGPQDIGRAISSDVLAQHRRSRSMSQLQDAVVDQESRNRSDEIRYWRESYDPGFMSPTSSNPLDDIRVVAFNTPESQPESALDLPPKTPPQPFNFGPMFGMKITQAASLEERIATLETRNQKLEKLIAQLFQVIPGVNNYSDSTGQGALPLPRESSATYAAGLAGPNPALYATTANEVQDFPRYGFSSRQSTESFGDGHTFIDSIAHSARPADRPTSNTTVRAATSLPTLSREASGPFTAEHYTTLLALVETERSARQALETQVKKLSNKLVLLSRALQEHDAPTASAFELDEEDEALDDDEGSEAYKTPREEKTQHGFGAFGEELREEEEDGSRKKAARTLSLSQLTVGKPPKAKAGVGVDL